MTAKQKSSHIGKIHCCHLGKGVGRLIISFLLTFLSLQPQPEVAAIKCEEPLNPHETHTVSPHLPAKITFYCLWAYASNQEKEVEVLLRLGAEKQPTAP